MFTQGPPDAGEGPYPNLLLKIGGAILESESQKGLITVHLTLNELWMVREVAKSSVVVGSERVGLSLLLKTYAGIRFLVTASVIGEFGEAPEGTDPETLTRFNLVKKILKEGGDCDDSRDDWDHSGPGQDGPGDDAATAA